MTSTLSTSTSTSTVVVTGPTRTETTTVSIGRKPTSKSTTVSTSAAECVPETIYITVGPGQPASQPVSTASVFHHTYHIYKHSLTFNRSTFPSVTTSPITKAISASAPYAMINSTSLNSGVGGTGVPQYKNFTATATGTGGLNYTSTGLAKPTFTGGAVNMLNHNKKCLVEIAAGLAVLFARRFV